MMIVVAPSAIELHLKNWIIFLMSSTLENRVSSGIKGICLITSAPFPKDMRIVHTTPMGSPLNESGIRNFLSNSVMNIQLATIDSNGDPSIQPVWYYYDQSADRLYACTDNGSQKVRNISRRDTVYFSVDEDVFPYRCVKGKGRARVSEDSDWNVPMVEKLMIKYLGSANHRWAKRILDGVKSGQSVVLEITPKYYSTWDFSNSE